MVEISTNLTSSARFMKNDVLLSLKSIFSFNNFNVITLNREFTILTKYDIFDKNYEVKYKFWPYSYYEM